MVTHWQDLESLKAFVGKNLKTPKVTQEAVSTVEEMGVDHFERFDKE